MSPPLLEQRNPYKGSSSKAWVRVRLVGPSLDTHDLDLLADTGSPFSIIISDRIMQMVGTRLAVTVPTNFGPLRGGWLRVTIPDVGFDQQLLCYASDAVVASSKQSSSDFEGLLGLPVLRMHIYGGDATAFWILSAAGPPVASGDAP